VLVTCGSCGKNHDKILTVTCRPFQTRSSLTVKFRQETQLPPISGSLLGIQELNFCFLEQYTLFQNGHYLSILLFTCKLAPVASFLNSKFKRIFPLSKATRAHSQVNKRILKCQPFWNKVY